MPSAPLYFDYAATTPVDDRVIETMLACLGRQANFGNPASSGHAYGQAARNAVEQARLEDRRVGVARESGIDLDGHASVDAVGGAPEGREDVAGIAHVGGRQCAHSVVD